MSDRGEEEHLPAVLIVEVAELPVGEAIALLRERGWWHIASAIELAEWALERAETDAMQAGRALDLAARIGTEHGEPPVLQAQIAYAEARRAVHEGDLAAAEQALLLAQERWRAIDAPSA